MEPRGQEHRGLAGGQTWGAQAQAHFVPGYYCSTFQLGFSHQFSFLFMGKNLEVFLMGFLTTLLLGTKEKQVFDLAWFKKELQL